MTFYFEFIYSVSFLVICKHTRKAKKKFIIIF